VRKVISTWLLIIIFVLLSGLVAEGVLSARQNSRLQAVENEIAVLKQNSVSGNPAVGQKPSSSVGVVAEVSPAIVLVKTTGANFLADGSGSIIDKRGYVLTNQHVIDQAVSIQVTYGGQDYPATLVASDTTLDVAILKLDASRSDFPTISLGSSAGANIGDDVLVFGFPLGLEYTGPLTVTRGIVSARRVLNNLNYLQSDAALNSGNSGGCMANMNGQIIGVPDMEVNDANTDIESIGLAIPIDEIWDFILKAMNGR
jgi:serine protease Do